MANGRNKPDPILREIASEDFDIYFEDARLRLGHAISLGQGTLRSLFLVNGGALVALLTLVGNANATIEERALFWAFVWFGAGLFSALGTGLAFSLSQMFYMISSNKEGWKAQSDQHGLPPHEDGAIDDRRGDIAITVTIVMAIASIGFFVTGAFVALDAIT